MFKNRLTNYCENCVYFNCRFDVTDYSSYHRLKTHEKLLNFVISFNLFVLQLTRPGWHNFCLIYLRINQIFTAMKRLLALLLFVLFNGTYPMNVFTNCSDIEVRTGPADPIYSYFYTINFDLI